MQLRTTKPPSLLTEKKKYGFEYTCLRSLLENTQLALNENKIPQQKVSKSNPNSNGDLSPHEWAQIERLARAMEVFEDEHTLPIVGEARSLTHAFSVCGFYAKRIVKFCKQIPPFNSLTRQEQMRILKPFYIEMFVVRCAFNTRTSCGGLLWIAVSLKEILFLDNLIIKF